MFNNNSGENILQTGSEDNPEKRSEYINNIKISWGLKVIDSENVNGVVPFSEIIEVIRKDNKIKELVEILNTIEGEKAQRKYKQDNLPYFITATLDSNRRLSEKLLSTQLMIFDYDHLDEQQVKAKREALIKDPNVLCIFKSPRGWLKVIYILKEEITDYQKYSILYKYYAEKFKASLGVKPDNTSDVVRACFFSYDPNIFVNYDAVPLETDIIIESNITIKKNQNVPANNITANPKETPDLLEAAKYLRDKIILDYDEWVLTGLALVKHPEFEKIFFQISKNTHWKDSETEVQAKIDNLISTSRGERNPESVFWIARKYGWRKEEEIIKNILPLSDDLINQFSIDDSRDPNKLLGYPLTKFASLASRTDGIQPGMYLISAETNVGKTAFLTNLGLDLLETNPDVTLIYFSLDDDRIKISYRFISILTELPHKIVKRGLQNIPGDSILIEEKRNYFLNLIEDGRIFIPDLSEVQNINQLEEFIKIHSGKKLVVCIDGLYNLDVDNSGGIREENIQRANKVKMIVDTYRIPVLVTGELRKKTQDQSVNKKPTLHDVMESGKYGYNDNMVWLLYPEKASDASSPDPIITLKYEKNKVSDYKEEQPLRFYRSSGVMKEWSLSSSAEIISGGMFD